MTQSYKDLIVWQKSLKLVKAVYSCTNTLPREELYGLASQLRRSAVSIPSNIAEGQRRKNRKEFLQFLNIAEASSAELETQLLILKEVFPTTDTQDVFSLSEEVQKMLSGLSRKLRT